MNSLGKTHSITGISSGVIAIIFTIAIETMFFGGLISAFLVKELGSAIWPPAGQPVLNSTISYFNTAFLIISGISLHFASYFISKDKIAMSKAMLLLTVILATLFLAIQGYEWLNLINFGFTTTSSLLGSFFYVIIGAHAFHALVGLLCLIYVFVRFNQGMYSSSDYNGMQMIKLYWSFVVLLWPLLYAIIYHN